MPHITVRRAHGSDIEAVVDLLCLMHREAPAGSLNVERVRATAADVLANGWIFVSSAPGGALAGTYALQTAQWWWSDDWYLFGRWLFTHPDHRNAPHAKLLIDAGKATADRLKVPLYDGVFSNRRLPGKVGMMQRALGEPVGAMFLYSPSPKEA